MSLILFHGQERVLTNVLPGTQFALEVRFLSSHRSSLAPRDLFNGPLLQSRSCSLVYMSTYSYFRVVVRSGHFSVHLGSHPLISALSVLGDLLSIKGRLFYTKSTRSPERIPRPFLFPVLSVRKRTIILLFSCALTRIIRD